MSLSLLWVIKDDKLNTFYEVYQRLKLESKNEEKCWPLPGITLAIYFKGEIIFMLQSTFVNLLWALILPHSQIKIVSGIMPFRQTFAACIHKVWV